MTPSIQALAVLAVAGTAAWRIWVAYRKTVTQEKERTSRLTHALDGASPPQRPEIIRACSLLESAARASSDDQCGHPPEPAETSAASPPDRRHTRRGGR